MKVRHILTPLGRASTDLRQQAVTGIVNAAAQIAFEQARRGMCVELLGWDSNSPAKTLMIEGVQFWIRPPWPWARLPGFDARWFLPALCHVLQSSPVDILHVHVELGMLYLPGAYAKVLNLRTPVPRPAPSAYIRLMRKADAIVCSSEFLRHQLLEAIPYRPDKVYVVYNGAKAVDMSDNSRGSLRKELGVSDDSVLLLYAGAIVPQKGVHSLLKAFGRVSAANDKLRLVVAGGSSLWRMEDYASATMDEYELGLHTVAEGLNVHFFGPVPHERVLELMAASDVFIYPSQWPEPFGIAIVEAMATGRVVIASHVGGIPEIISDGETGILVPPGDVDALAMAISRVAADHNLRERMGRAARERARFFTWRAAVEKLEQIYQALLAEKGKP